MTKTPKTISKKSDPKAEQIETIAKSAPTKKASPVKKAPKLEPVVEAPSKVVKDEPIPAIPVQERVGLTAGSIWQYLSQNGATSVAKLIKELPEEEKIIQRSIGWLAQENKITLELVNRVETIALK